MLHEDADAAAEHYSALAGEKGTVGPAFFSVDHVLGLLAKTMGNLDDAATHFENATTFCRNANYRPELAWTLYDYSEMLSKRNQPEDSEKASELLDEALNISTNLGMRTLMERALLKRDNFKP